MIKLKKNVSGFTSLVLGTSMLIGGTIAPFSAAAADATTTQITVDPSDVMHAIQPGLFGVNHRYFVDGVGMWDAKEKRVNPKFDKAVKDIGLKAVRYPGGTTANLFWWKRSIGPTEQRMNQINPYLGNGPEKSNFGLDEGMRFSESNGYVTPYVYNVGNGNPQDAADLVEYLNAPADAAHPWAMKRAENGHPAPYNIKDFEIGNEINLFPTMRYWLDGKLISNNPDLVALNNNTNMKIAYLYVNGGTVKFTLQKTGLIDDWRDGTMAGDPMDASQSNGSSNQVKYAKYAPIDLGSQVDVSVGNDVNNPSSGKSDWVGETWTRVASLSGAGAINAYELDYSTGVIKFGSGGNNGNIPASGKEIRVTYQTTHAGFGEYYNKMKAVDPSIKIYSAMDQDYAITAFGKNVPYDGLVIHPYSGGFATPYDPNNVPKYHYASILDAELKIHETKEKGDASSQLSGRSIKPIVTEFGPHDPESKKYQENGVSKTALLYEGSLGATLQTANMLMHFIDMDMEYALRHSLIDRTFENKSAVPMALFDTYTFLPSASANMYKMFTHMSGENEVKSSIVNNPIRTINIDNKDQNINKLMTVASATGDDLYLIVLNQDATDAVSSNVQLKDYKAGTAEAWTLNGDKLDSINTNEKPDTVKIDTAKMNIQGDHFTYTFPAHSLTAFKFSSKWKDMKGHWAEKQLQEGVTKGIINGYDDGSLLPDRAITRAEFVAIMSRALHVQGNTANAAFADASQIPAWALADMNRAANAGWLTGFEDNTVRPNQLISRAEIVAILGRAMKLDGNGTATTSFVDDAWAKSFVAQAAASGIVNGREGNNFGPNEKATRAEVVVAVLRMLAAAAK
ncbi:hypothetical protein GCM10008018_20960 [Paenibacillus marchantiophytorum]|uniref:non-reducing end alpha-L-arabinofuranosidase n=1 Tax=Paenibacillus marchantiophytorum TaxID=1619310 RepID=A0ABQ1EK36_9BACL|nr:S-layer homology domain-containing protein [Paenibacillus marchantiophytorum]GFZ75708.1 hypothetical protein GCM10008018_20960 [Paenibacillus marchantiophytorum]